ncbi:carboxyl transferase domain-containing protein [Leptospira sp. GIMC2001]|uniref:carboxyl transferase domain-containing protein n=1 Tax=Leptospira sp. GIMC2001 TaxID=1513297 RepID=UPI00234AEBC8|nr:carboxyl transferase domain-containing protein [Leptospira sp. GIMC2001]WCL50168.1 carbamoyl-phosphate synthase subunit L [Leptospira sp. GIMC2001]
MFSEIEPYLKNLTLLNPGFQNKQLTKLRRTKGRLQKVLIANRGEIAKRFFLSLREEGIPSVAVVTDVDLGQSWYEFADEFIRIGDLSNYTNIPLIVSAAIFSNSNSIYPGYGFLSENPAFVRYIKVVAEACNQELIFMGPDDSVMEKVGDKLSARKLASEHGVPLFEGSHSIQNFEEARSYAAKIGYPIIVKLSNGGGGKGMVPVFQEAELSSAIESSKRIGKSLYNDDTFYLEKYITKPVHMEVQIFNSTAIGIRKCAVQRRNQKVIEESGDAFIDDYTCLSLLASAENMARISGYSNGSGAGTVEFLYDQDSGSIGFLEMNTRLQVEHPVTDQSLGIDLAKWQIYQFDGRESNIHYKTALEKRFTHKDHAIECRIYAEDPESGYTPSPGIIEELDLPTFNGTRCDFGFRKGDIILPHYDPMIGKVITRGDSREVAISRMERALSELYIKGITSNVNQLLLIMRDPDFLSGDYTNRLLDDKSYLEENPIHENDVILGSAFATLCEYVNLMKTKAANSFQVGDLEKSVYNSGKTILPTSFQVEIGEFKNTISLIQTDIQSFHIFLNNLHLGEADIVAKPASVDNYLIRVGISSYTVRIDSRPNFSIIRIKNMKNRTSYLRMKITSEGLGNNTASQGITRSPFQGSFVKFARDEFANRDRLSIGSLVKKGDPIIVISAMKMETVIASPTNGKIKQLIEDGDLSKLQIGFTPQGQIIGKNIAEGEILFNIESDKIEESISVDSVKKQSNLIRSTPLSDYSSALESIFLGKIDTKISDYEKLKLYLSIIRSYISGYPIDESVYKTSIKSLADIDKVTLSIDESKSIESEIRKIITIHCLLKNVYAPSVGDMRSIFNELNDYIQNCKDEMFSVSTKFKNVMDSLFKVYGVTRWIGITDLDITEIQFAIFFMQRAYYNISNNSKSLECILNLITLSSPIALQKNTSSVLKRLYSIEESEKDGKLFEVITSVLKRYNILNEMRMFTQSISRKYLNEFLIFRNDPYSFYANGKSINRDNWIDKLNQSFAESLSIVPNSKDRQDFFFNEVSKKVLMIQEKYSVNRLHSPIGDLLIYSLESKTVAEDKRYLLFYNIGKMDEDRDIDNKIIGSNNAERATIESAFLLKNYQMIQPRLNNQIEILAHQKPSVIDLGEDRDDILSSRNLFPIILRVNHFLKGLEVSRIIVHLACQSPMGGDPVHKKYLIAAKNGKVTPDLLLENDPRDLYYDKNFNQATNRLLEKNKWPIEIWARENFDPDTFEEIVIPSIDHCEWINPKNGKSEFKPVGSKIYLGKIANYSSIFYMKDSRINGGSTGDLEGLKYIAAMYLAYKWNIPIYIWNDGAGANIKEGMISLNRAGQGFMMNSLLTSERNEQKFRKFTLENPDSRLRSLFNELDADFIDQNSKIQNSRCIVVAIGVGSSTGLDVYGSSQASIQLMVDMDESYRVLTGSNVIKSVMGEDFTNYEIGGASVMSKWTGTVDIVAEHKLQLLSIIRKIQKIFTPRLQSIPLFEKTKVSNRKWMNPLNRNDVVNDQMVMELLDDREFTHFKSDYYGSGSLIGGFGRLNQSPVCILGARTNYGIRSFPSVTRAKELSITANKTKADKILIFGKRWFYEFMNKDAQTIQARKDFLNNYAKGSGMKIQIVTELSGLERAPILSLADIIFFIKSQNMDGADILFASKSVHFISENLESAFEVCGRILEYVNNRDSSPIHLNRFSSVTELEPEIPTDPTVPFDMFGKVISRTFDKDSFIEFFQDMNDPIQGPCLITGLAKLNNETVGVIADQPSIMGGAPDAPGTEKFRIFTEFLNKYKIPIVMISNAPGFYPGTKQERLRIQQIGAESLDANILGEVPVVSVVLNQNYGGRQIHAFSKTIRPGIVYMSLESSILSVMGGSASFDLFMGARYSKLLQEGNNEQAIQLKEDYIQEFNNKSRASVDAANTGIMDFLIPKVSQLRKYLIDGLSLAKERKTQYFD